MAIAKISRPRRARATMSYLLQAQDHMGRQRKTVSIVASTIGQTLEMADEYLSAISNLRPRLSRHLYHVSISVSPNDRDLSNQEWADIGRAWCDEMGLQNFMIVLHDNHIHILASRIRMDGTAASDRFDYRRSETVLRGLEARFELLPTESSHLLDPRRQARHRRAQSIAELHATAKEGISHKDFIRAAIDAALIEAPDETLLRDALAKVGIGMTIDETLDGALHVLFSFRGRIFGPRALGRGYSLSHLVEKGLQIYDLQDQLSHLPTPPWNIDTSAITPPSVNKNHATAVHYLRNLGLEAEDAVARFRKWRGAAKPRDHDLYGPGQVDTDDPPI